MKRRDFIALGAAAVARPLAARAQARRMPLIGFLSSTSAAGFAFYVTAFRDGLKEAGYFEGWNVEIDYCWAEDQMDRLPVLAAGLVKRKVGAIFADDRSAVAAKAVTTAIPIVFCSGRDPIKSGLVHNLDQPGGNVTGVSFPVPKIATKRLQILHTMLPKAATIGYLFAAETLFGDSESNEIENAARDFGLQLHAMAARDATDVEAALAAFVARGAQAMIVGSGPQLISERDRIVALAARHAIAAIYDLRPWVTSGGLMSFGGSVEHAARQCGGYVARVLKGIVAADLPVIRSAKVELVINLNTAKTLGLTVPQTLMIAADEVIE
jgi:putative tryptophan/tyrosine transport system substrate-binding protein